MKQKYIFRASKAGVFYGELASQENTPAGTPKRDCKDCAMFLNGKCTKPHWKPSEEQMEALNYAIAEWDGGKKLEGLYALRTDLKKLGVKEEPEYYQHFDPDC